MTSADDESVYFVPECDIRDKIFRQFHQAKRKLQALLPGADIQHVGSTAIPGSLTKGDLDVQVRVSASQYAAAKERLCELYQINSGGFAAEDAASFEDYSSELSLGVHLTVAGGSADVQSRFRDLLIASPALCREYDELKRHFEGKSMARYREEKWLFVEKVLGRKA